MNILGFNTSTEKFSLAISKNNQIVYYISKNFMSEIYKSKKNG